MSTHLVCFDESFDSATLQTTTVVPDDVLTVPQTDRIIVPVDYHAVHAAAAVGVSLTRARIVTPSLERQRATQEIIPHERGAAQFTLAAPKVYFPSREVVLDPGEALTLETSEDGAGASRVYAGVWLKKPGPLPPIPAGPVFRARLTGTTTLTADAWTSVALTLQNELPAGIYALVGLYANSVSGVFVRAIIPGQAVRPGGVCITAASDAAGRFYNSKPIEGLQGYEMGRFSQLQIPQVQFLAAAADTAENVDMDLVKVG